ncbi:unnamed protein product [Cunninghamella echinulata]
MKIGIDDNKNIFHGNQESRSIMIQNCTQNKAEIILTNRYENVVIDIAEPHEQYILHVKKIHFIKRYSKRAFISSNEISYIGIHDNSVFLKIDNLKSPEWIDFVNIYDY